MDQNPKQIKPNPAKIKPNPSQIKPKPKPNPNPNPNQNPNPKSEPNPNQNLVKSWQKSSMQILNPSKVIGKSQKSYRNPRILVLGLPSQFLGAPALPGHAVWTACCAHSPPLPVAPQLGGLGGEPSERSEAGRQELRRKSQDLSQILILTGISQDLPIIVLQISQAFLGFPAFSRFLPGFLRGFYKETRVLGGPGRSQEVLGSPSFGESQ